jgi:hypothetical protein
MVWDGMTPEEQEIAKTVISGEKDWVIWRMKPAQIKPGEDAAEDRIHQASTAFSRGVWYDSGGDTASWAKIKKS